jgi:hypothetical protein
MPPASDGSETDRIPDARSMPPVSRRSRLSAGLKKCTKTLFRALKSAVNDIKKSSCSESRKQTSLV